MRVRPFFPRLGSLKPRGIETRRVLAISMLCALAFPASAAGPDAWYVLKTDDGLYAYEPGNILDVLVPERDAKSVWLLSGNRNGYSSTGFIISCRTNRGELVGPVFRNDELLDADGNVKPGDPGWISIPDKGAMKVAADVVCGRHLEGAIRVDSEPAAVDKLKELSN